MPQNFLQAIEAGRIGGVGSNVVVFFVATDALHDCPERRD